MTSLTPPGVGHFTFFFVTDTGAIMLEGFSLETISSQVFEFEGKARANPIGAIGVASFLGKLLVLPANVRLD